MLRELIYPNDDVTQARPAIQKLQRTTKWLRENLKIAPRSLPKLEGDIRLQFGKFYERLLPFDNELPAELATGKLQLTDYMNADQPSLRQTRAVVEHTCSSQSPHTPSILVSHDDVKPDETS
jgi:hypothetical protein